MFWFYTDSFGTGIIEKNVTNTICSSFWRLRLSKILKKVLRIFCCMAVTPRLWFIYKKMEKTTRLWPKYVHIQKLIKNCPRVLTVEHCTDDRGIILKTNFLTQEIFKLIYSKKPNIHFWHILYIDQFHVCIYESKNKKQNINCDAVQGIGY